jgi:hypothetical protein
MVARPQAIILNFEHLPGHGNLFLFKKYVHSHHTQLSTVLTPCQSSLLEHHLFPLYVDTMAAMATSLSRALPKPKYTGEDEELPTHTQSRGPRVVGAGVIDESQIVLKVSTGYSR